MNERHDMAGAGEGPGVGASERDPHRGDVVSLRAQRVAMLATIVARVRAVGERMWALPLVALGLVIVDAAIQLPGWARAALGATVMAMALWVVVALLWPGRAGRLSVLGAARLLEDQLGLRDNALVNALQLRTALVSGDGVTAALAERVMDHGVEVVRASEGERVVDGRRAVRAWVFVLGAVAVVMVSVAAMPRVWGAGVPRYVDPFGDHPAWSPTKFRVDVSPREVLAGDDATVTVRLTGKIPEAVALVFVDGSGRELDRADMGGVLGGSLSSAEAPKRPSEYRLTLHDLREPVRFYPAAETGRGAATDIAVLDKPRVEAATLVVRAPTYTGVAPTSERVDLAEGDVKRRVLVGSVVELRVDSSVEIGDVDRSGGTATGDIDVSGRSVTQRVVARKAGEELLSLRPVSRSGLRADDAVRVALDEVADTPPRVTVRAPAGAGERAAALEGTGVPVRAIAEDDVRVASLGVEWQLKRAEERGEVSTERAALGVERPMRKRWDGQLVIDTGAIGARAGDEIDLWVEAMDNRGEAFGGAQTTRVGPIAVSVIDQKEFRRRTLERMGIDDIVGAYEDIARTAADLAKAARKAAEAAERAAKGEGSAEDAARAEQEALAKRDALMAAIEQRLVLDPLVDFDQAMRAPLEHLRDRLGDFERVGRAGESPDEAAARAERNAARADLASHEASLDLGKPAEQLRLAAQMRTELDHLDRIAKRQRALSDKLGAMRSLPAPAAVRIAEDQRKLMEETDDVCVRLDRLGDEAANELPGVAALEGAKEKLTRSRRDAQEAIEAARSAADASASNLVDAMMRAEMRDAADAALTDLYFASDPALDAAETMGNVVGQRGARLDDPDVAKAASDGRDKLRKALEAVEQIEQYLDRVRERVRRESAGRTAQRGRRWSPAAIVGALVVGIAEADGPASEGVKPSTESASIEDDFVRALETARVRLGALKVRLREAEQAMGAPLPVMGESAMDLAQRVNAGEIAETMYDAEGAMHDGDLTAARARADVAADRLEALYESATGGPSECKGGDDTPLRLIKGEPPPGSNRSTSGNGAEGGSSRSAGSSGTSAGSASGQSAGSAGGLPNALDVLSRSSGDAQGSGSGSDETQGRGSKDDPSDRAGFKREGSTPGPGAGRGGEGEGGASGHSAKGDKDARGQGGGDTDSGHSRSGSGDPRLADRARRYNERLYAEPIRTDKPIEGEGEGARTEADVIHLKGEPMGREAGLRSELARAGVSGAEVQAVFERVPPAYRDVVAAYLMRIARDEAAGEDRGSMRSP